MIKIKSLFLLAVSLLLGAPCFAQKENLTADTVLARTLRVADADSAREARIIMTSIRNGKVERSYGLFSWKPDHAIMSFYDSVNTSFLESRMIQIKDTFWVYNGQRNDVNIIYGHMAGAQNRLDGTFTTGRSGFNKPILDTIYGDSIAVITLIPTDSKKIKATKVIQHIDLRSYRLIEQTMYRSDGSSVSVKFIYVQINQPIADEVFLFKESQYPEYLDVIDNRKEHD